MCFRPSIVKLARLGAGLILRFVSKHIAFFGHAPCLSNFHESANARWIEVRLRKSWPQECPKKRQSQNTV